jgi:radical SAM protein with 4Fe4S-binding SPASM domain
MVLALPDAGEGQAQQGICHLPFNRIHVTQEGYLTLCCVDFQNYLALADLNKMSLAEAWTSERFREMRRRHLADQLTGTLCGRCWKAERCRIEPVVPEYADTIDFDAFDSVQRKAIREELQTERS